MAARMSNDAAEIAARLLSRRDIVIQNSLGSAEDFLNQNSTPSNNLGSAEDFLKDTAPKRTATDVAKDVGITLAKSVIAVPESAVGIADIFTEGRAGKSAENLGFRPKEAKSILDEFLSPAQKLANKKVAEADGLVDTVKTAIQNPSTILNAGIESLPLIAGGGVVGIGARALKASRVIAGAIGEGVVGAGIAAEGIRQQTVDGLLTGKQAGLSALSGVLTALFGAAGGKIAQKLGIANIDTLAVGGATQASNKGFTRKLVEGGITEGVFEELPQSIQEQILQNAALDKPLTEGVGNAAALGLLTGSALGGGVSALTGNGKDKLAISQGDSASDDAVAAQKQAEFDAQQAQPETANINDGISPDTAQAQPVDEFTQFTQQVDADIENRKVSAGLKKPTEAIPAADILGEDNVNSANDGLTPLSTEAAQPTNNQPQGGVGDIPVLTDGSGVDSATTTPASGIGENVATGTGNTGNNAVERPFASATDDLLPKIRSATTDANITSQIDSELALRGITVPDSQLDANSSQSESPANLPINNDSSNSNVDKSAKSVQVASNRKVPTSNPLFEKNKETLRNILPRLNFAVVGNKRTDDADDADGNQIGRSKFVPIDGGLDAIRAKGTLSYNGMQNAVNKALRGEPLSKQEHNTIDELSKFAEDNKEAFVPVSEEGAQRLADARAAEPNLSFDQLFFGEDTKEAKTAVKELSDDDLFEGASRILAESEVDAIFNSKGTENEQATDNRRTEAQIGNNDANQTGVSRTQNTQAVKTTGQNQEVRSIVERIVKRRAAANELNKLDAFDNSLAEAKKLLNGDKVSITKLRVAVKAFSGDAQLSDAFAELVNIAAPQAKEDKQAKVNGIETYKQRIANAKSTDELKSIQKEISKDEAVSDKQLEVLDDLAIDALDKFTEEDNATDTTTTQGTKRPESTASSVREDTGNNAEQAGRETSQVDDTFTLSQQTNDDVEADIQRTRDELKAKEQSIAMGKFRSNLAGLNGDAKEESPKQNIQDFGEKILVKKDAFANYKNKVDQSKTVDIKSEPLSKSWPETNYQELIDEGLDPWLVGFIHAARDEVPTKPKAAWKLKGWVDKVNVLRDLSFSIIDGTHTKQSLVKILGGDSFTRLAEHLNSRIDLYQAVGHERSLGDIKLRVASYSFYEGKGHDPKITLWTVDGKNLTGLSHWPVTYATASTRQGAIDKFKDEWNKPRVKQEKKSIEFGIWSRRTSGLFFIGKKIGRNIANLKDGFKTAKEARLYLSDNQSELVDLLDAYKNIPNERREVNEARVGEDHRNSANVSQQQFSETFGFRAVVFGNNVEQVRRQKDLNDAYDALMDLSVVIGIPPKALSLNGELGLLFGADGNGGKNPASAHFSTDKIAINLTKKNGAGSLAHELFHALDNHFSRKDGKNGFLTEAQTAGANVRPEMVLAFKQLMNAINNTSIKERSRNLDKRRTNDYWSTGLEMAARSFESYVINKLQDQGASNDYLANIVSEEDFNREGEYPYPTAAEMPAIRDAFDNFFATLETEETGDGNVAVFSRAENITPDAATRNSADPQGTYKEQVQKSIDTLTSKWKNAPEIIVVSDMNDPAIRKAVRDENERQLSQGAQGQPEGFFDAGKVYIISSEVNSEEDIARVLFHETLGHFGLRGTFGKELGGVLDRVAALRPNDMEKKGIEYGLDVNNLSDRRIIAEEVLAEMAQTTPNAGLVKSAIAIVRKFLRSIGLDLKLTDNDIIVNYIVPARNFVANSKSERQTAGSLAASFNRNDSPSTTQLFKELTLNDDMFQYRKSASADLQQVFNDIATKLVKVEKSNINDDEIQDFYNIYPIDSSGNVDRDQPGQVIVYKDGNVEINVLQWQEGFGGSSIYASVGNWAFNNKKVFSGDRKGITPAGKMRRLENMISLALKFGTTDHIAPHPEQMQELGFDWREGDTDYNIGQMLEASYNAIRNGVYVTENNDGIEVTQKSPNAEGVAKLDDIVYDFDEQQFIEVSSGKPYTDEKFRILAQSRQARATHAGSATLKRAAITSTSLRAKSGTQRKRLLELISRLTFQRLDNTQLNQIFYSRGESQTDTREFKSWFDTSKVIDKSGKPLVVYHGTTASFDEFKDLNQRQGYYFAEDFGYSNLFAERNFGANVIPAYLSIKNPADLRSGISKNLLEQLDKQGYDTSIFESYTPDDYWGLFDGYTELADALKASDYDGVRLTEPKSGDTQPKSWLAFYPTQIKSAIGNNGNFDANNPSIVFSRNNNPGARQKNLTPKFNIPQDSKMDSIYFALQDKNIDLKRVTESIKKAGTDIADRWNAYLQEELYHGRTAKRTQDFIKNDLEPLIEDMRMRGVEMADFEEYLWARHAEERNIQIAKVNPDMQDGGSGMSTQDARDYLANLSDINRTKFKALAARVDLINTKSRQVLVDYGLESTETIAAWEGAYKNYVPLMREDMETGFGSGTGQGFSVKGNASKRATGSKRAVVDIIANIAQQHERNIIRGEKNRVSTALIGLATLNPNDEFWQVGSPPKIKSISKTTGFVQELTDPNYKNRDNVIVARIVDRFGKIQERSVVFNEFDERAMRMSKSLKNLDQDQVGEVLGAAAGITRYFSSINTQFNPIFGIVNITRDVQGALLNLSTTPIADKKAEVLGNTLSALKGIYTDLRSQRNNGSPANNQWASLFEEFQNEGGQTGFRDMFRNSKERSDALKNALDPTWWKNSKVGKIISANGVLANQEQWVFDKAIKPVFDWLSDYNNALENAVRLSAYKVAIDNGQSKQQAASIAKNISVNFNRKGEMGRQIGSLYAFFNASIQGTARIGETLTVTDANGRLKLGKIGKRIVQGGLLLGAMQAVLLAASGYDDDEPPEFVRDRSLIFPLDLLGADGKFISIPMPLGYNAIPSFGRILTEWALSGFDNTQERLVHVIDMLFDVTNPIGNAGLSLQTISPTVIDPLASLAENKDFTGRPIARTDFNSLDPTPGFKRTKDTASMVSKALAYGVNGITGGTDFKPGTLSPTPDQIDFLIGQITGGVGREVLKVEQTATSIVTGENLPVHKIPVVGRFFGDTTGQSSQGTAFYRNLLELNKHENEIKGLRESGQNVAQYRLDNPESILINQANHTQRAVQKLNKMRRMLLEKDASPDEIKRINERITVLMTSLNEKVKAKKEK